MTLYFSLVSKCNWFISNIGKLSWYGDGDDDNDNNDDTGDENGDDDGDGML